MKVFDIKPNSMSESCKNACEPTSNMIIMGYFYRTKFVLCFAVAAVSPLLFFTGVLFQLLFFPWTHSGWSGGLPLHLGGHCVWGCDVTIWFEIFFMFWDVVLWSVICAAMFCVVLLRPSLESVEVGLPRCIVPLRPPAGATRQRSPHTSVSLANATRVVTLAWLLYWK